MALRLYTINFSIFLSILGFIVFFDFSCYRFAYPFYDKLYHLEKINDDSKVVFIGSSGILWDVDDSQFTGLTGKKSTMFSVAGGTMEFRYFFLKDLLSMRSGNLPEVVVFHTDRIGLNRNRYGDGAYKSLQGYYHRGILREYLDYKWNNSLDSKFKKISRAYSLNSEAYFILSKIFDRYIPGLPKFSLLGDALYADEMNSNLESKLEKWRELYGSPENFSVIDPDFRLHFEKSIELMKNYPQVQFILLDTPMVKLFDDKYFYQIQKIYSDSSYKNIHYISINKEKYNSMLDLYHDASHLNLFGRASFTEDFYLALKEKKIINP